MDHPHSLDQGSFGGIQMNDILIGPWQEFLAHELQNIKEDVRVISPFASKDGIALLTEGSRRDVSTRLITRCNSSDFIKHVNSAPALKSLVESGGRVRIQDRYLHSKLYLFDSRIAVVSSSNLTYCGLNRNAEIGVVVREPSMIHMLVEHFEDAWDKLSEDLTVTKIQLIIKHIKKLSLRLEGDGQSSPGEDWGTHLAQSSEADLDRGTEEPSVPITAESSHHWIKFIWRRSDPAPIDREIQAISEYQGAVTFPPHPGHPRNIQSGHTVYHTAIANTYRGIDWLVYGKGVAATNHRDGIDEFPKQHFLSYPDIARYPYLIWLNQIELIGGRIQDGISLHDIFDQLKDDTFVRSAHNANRGIQNTFKSVIRQQSHLELTPAAVSLLNSKMEEAFAIYGKISEPEGSSVWWNADVAEEHKIHRA